MTVPGEVLDRARASAKSGEYPIALANYELFFDRALQDQGEDHNYYGVRLSYCLREWARLGTVYPPARQRIEEKADEALAAFEATSDDEKFHDYQAIMDCLDKSGQVLSQFLSFHRSDPALAKLAARFMWTRLIDARLWDVCAVYLGDPLKRYGQALNTFDTTMTMCKSDPSLGGEDFAEQIKGWYVRDAGNVLRVLNGIGRPEVAKQIVAEVSTDMGTRGYPELVLRIDERAAL